MTEDGPDLIFGKNDRQALRLFGPDDIRQGVKFLLQDFPVEEEDGAEGLALGGGGDVAFDSQMGEEGDDFGRAQVFGVAFVMEEDEAFDPIHIGFFGADGIVFEADGVAKLIEEFGRVFRRVIHRRSGWLF